MVTPGFAAGEKDTTCIPPLYLYVKELKKQYPDLKISILAIHYPFQKESYSYYGATVYPLNGRNKNGWLRVFFRPVAFNNFLDKLQNEISFDILHSFWLGESSYLAAKYSKRNKIPHLVTLMGQDAVSGSFRSYASFRPELKPEKIIVLSDYHNEKFNQTFKLNDAIIIPWGIDELVLSSAEKKIDITGIGNLIDLKDYNRFIEIIRMLKMNFPRIKVNIIGKGQEERKLKEKIISSGLSENIQITGELPRAEALQLLQGTKVFLHTSKYESFGYVLTEALACCCHVISTPVGFAYKNPDIYTFENNEEAVELCKKLLNSETSEKRLVPKMKDTVKLYSEIYLQLLSDHMFCP